MSDEARINITMNKLSHTLNWVSNQIAIKSVVALSTMSCVFAFFLWSMIPLVFPAMQGIVFYISGGVLQLVLLPLIMVGQKLSSTRSSTNHDRLNQRQDQITHVLTDIHTLMKDQDEDAAVLRDIQANQRILASQVAELAQLVRDQKI